MNSFGVFSMSDMRGERLQVMLSPEELTAIDDFRFEHRMPTRAAAVRELLKMGLTVVATDGGGMKSSNYGVFDRGPDGTRTAPIRIRRRSADLSRHRERGLSRASEESASDIAAARPEPSAAPQRPNCLQCSKSYLCYWKEHLEVRPRLDHLGDDHDYSTSRRFGAQFPPRRPTNAPHIRRQAGTSAACVGSSRKYLPRYEELRSRPLHALPRRRGRRS